MRQRWKIALAIVLAALALVVALAAFNTELRLFALHAVWPAAARDSTHRCVTREAQTICFVGTIHTAHLESKEFGLGHLERALQRYSPDVVLVESRPSRVDQGDLADGPIEMLYVALRSRDLNLELCGIDWWSPSEQAPNGTDDRRDDEMNVLLLRCAKNKKQSLVFVGYSHVAEQISRLERSGWSPAPLPGGAESMWGSVAEVSWPTGASAHLRSHLAAWDDEADGLSGAWREAFQARSDHRRSLLPLPESTGGHAPADE